ncbi:DUF2142 domain-containing protein [Niveispirillum sp. KHB5.9]|uniref:DUF2142 domain-containing protein n=1 Tax=Niveispirillum sp. KHB5.9 TaxID=3400269 RepID=UPI003A87E299
MPRNIAVLLFALLALPVASLMAWVMPPYFNVDETNHVMRAETVLQGQVLGVRDADGSSGGVIDTGLLTLLSRYWPVMSEPGGRVGTDRMAEAATIPWAGETRFVNIPNTAIYPPTLYLPTMAGLWLGKGLDLPVEASIRLARLANILCAVGLVAAALRLAAFGHGPMLAICLWPMCLAQYAACSQDGLFIALGALYAALLSRAIAGGRKATGAEFLGLALITLLISMSRPANLALLLPLLFIMPGRIGRVPAWLALPPVLLLTMGWALHAVLYVQVMQVHGDVVPDLRGQLAHLASHPLDFPIAMAATLGEWLWPFTVAMLGWIGWGQVNIVLPDALYPAYLWGFGLLLVLSALSPGNRPAWMPKAGVALGLLGTIIAIFLLQYLTFTAVGADQVDGVQGRYFAPLALLPGLLVPALGHLVPPRLQAVLPAAAGLVLVALGIATAIFLPYAVMMRLYVTAG